MFYLLNVITVHTWVTILNISGIYSHTPNPQNNYVSAPAATKKSHVASKCLLQTHLTFSKSVMVSMGVSKLGLIDLSFVDAGVKSNGTYYRDILLTQNLLPAMHEICAVFFIFQQCNAPAAAHRA